MCEGFLLIFTDRFCLFWFCFLFFSEVWDLLLLTWRENIGRCEDGKPGQAGIDHGRKRRMEPGTALSISSGVCETHCDQCYDLHIDHGN